GLMMIERDDGIDEDELLLHALEAGAEDVQTSEDGYEIYTAPNDFTAVRDELEGQGYVFLSAERQKIPQNYVDIEDEETLEKVMKLLEMLEDNDDIMDIYHNANLPEDEDEE
ncbi:MAG TPA: YebC/PmpR family DNA-binding transcriptional regulator, partial [Clostridia bacterium]|nr:YebC/PmpR family DNA-binding transcriptional regulator [Clostridia bacterium]